MKEIFYKKVGRKYVAISEYDNTFLDSFSYGDHLVSVYKNGSSRSLVEPSLAPMVAAGRYAINDMYNALSKASEMRPRNTPITEGQRKAWKKLAKEFGDELCTLQHPAVQDIAEAGIRALEEEAAAMLTVPAVKNAYDHFMMIYQLTKETKENK